MTIFELKDESVFCRDKYTVRRSVNGGYSGQEIDLSALNGGLCDCFENLLICSCAE